MDTLQKHAISGINQMPPRGTCTDCSDDEIKAAIEYMTQGL
ncbi:MAG: c-type cytochrome [Plesiomonas sp.]